jgi:hypothetical protein
MAPAVSSRITIASYVPFLHLILDNISALKLCERLGFRTRKQMLVNILEMY